MFSIGNPLSSRAMYFISYDKMMPFLSSSNGSCQVTRMSVGDSAEALVSVGGASGATRKE